MLAIKVSNTTVQRLWTINKNIDSGQMVLVQNDLMRMSYLRSGVLSTN